MKNALSLAKEKIVFLDSDVAFSYFCSQYTKGQAIVVAVSGGADSVFMLLVVLQYIYRIGGSETDVVVVHCDHQTRLETKKEAEYVREFCLGLQVDVFEYYDDKFDENSLRQRRWSCFRQCCEDHKTNFVVTGHHFSDRMETSLLHLYRGCGVLGLSNMSMMDKKHHQGFLFRVFRPLLSELKKNIKKQCLDLDIDYIIDPTNFDMRGGMRSIMRHSILPQLLENWDFLPLMKQFYSGVERHKENLRGLFQTQQILISQYRDVDWGVRLLVDRSDISISLLILLLQQVGVYHNITQGLLVELCQFLQKNKQGYKYYGGIVFTVAHDVVYLFAGEPDFWEKQIARSKQLDRVGEHFLGDYSVSIDETLVGSTLRFAKEGDHYHGKRLKKYLINNKIPFFRRNFVLVAERDGKIEAVFDTELMAQCQI